jgi:hypothetical protein
MRSDIAASKTTLEDERKQKTLERALGLTEVNSFAYFVENTPKYYHSDMLDQNSSELAKTAIKWFMLGYGHIFHLRYIDKGVILQS